MADQELHQETAPFEAEASYSVISYPALQLPEAYKGLIFSKWLRTLREGNPVFKKSDPHEYYKNYHPFIDNLMRKPDSSIRLAVLSDDHDVVLGFAVSREDVLDYIYVHKDYRLKGIGFQLFPAETTTFSHITQTAINIWQGKSKYKYLKFNPFA